MLGICLALRHKTYRLAHSRTYCAHLEVVGHEGGEEGVHLLLTHQRLLGARTEAARPALVVDAALGAGEARAAALVDGLVPSQGKGEGEGEGGQGEGEG